MMRVLAPMVAALMLIPCAALAQTAVERAQVAITAQNIAAGHAPAIAEGLANCFTSVMSEDEAEVILASEPGAAQNIAARMMQHYDDAVACTAGVIQ